MTKRAQESDADESNEKRPRVQAVKTYSTPWKMLTPGIQWADALSEGEESEVMNDDQNDDQRVKRIVASDWSSKILGLTEEVNDDIGIDIDIDEEAVGDIPDEPVEFDPVALRAAREEELQYFDKIALYDEVPVKACWDATGKAPLSTKWVDVMKNADGQRFVRSRLVARDFREKTIDVKSCSRLPRLWIR